MDSRIQKAVDRWLTDPAIADVDKCEIRDLITTGNESELTDRFYRDLEFGTGGLRGVIGAGTNRMNIYTVGAAAQGLAGYIVRQGENAREAGVAIAYDCRRMSTDFAQRTACVMAANGIKAYLFEALRPTPELSFAVRELGCTAGVVITASHNPPEYNGFKAYWSDGVQVVPPHDHAIIEEVKQVGGFDRVRSADLSDSLKTGMIQMVGREIDQRFLEQVRQSCLSPGINREQGAKLKIIFTSLHGTGGTLIPQALRQRGFRNVIEVPEQAEPDGEFPTVESPNPEEPAALRLGIELAKRESADLVIGTDPDADRVGIAVRRTDGEFELLTGNRIASLLTYYICEQLREGTGFPDDAVLITTIVSGDMMKDIARSYGADVIETLTGFKWIGEQVSRFDAARAAGKMTKMYIFGAEESYGYMPMTYVGDKDAVTSAAFIADATAWAASRDLTLLDLLNTLFTRFGYYQEGAKSLTLKGKEGLDRITNMMESFRTNPPTSIGGLTVRTIGDLKSGDIHSLSEKRVIDRYDLPSADVVVFTLEDGTKAIARPSGTEPKIKFYVLARHEDQDLDRARRETTKKIDAIIADMANA